ncbi:MAG: type II toxin-antitoxin system Phd/YefM family antitoxin [Acidobacteriia bacterium]|nr:type II toxin-antitoxin system Phd/YefM family antitoxin [Terriglobia bacterium]
MKKMTAGFFKVHCLAVVDEVHAKRETVLITKHGKPIAKLAC